LCTSALLLFSSAASLLQFVGGIHRKAGLLISNIDIDIDSIDDTFGVSISVSTILLGNGIESSIDDTFKAVFSDISISILLS
jgi:hypothetical protein